MDSAGIETTFSTFYFQHPEEIREFPPSIRVLFIITAKKKKSRIATREKCVKNLAISNDFHSVSVSYECVPQTIPVGFEYKTI